MLKWLKKYFIPHPENDHRPHFFRTEITVFVLAFVLLGEVIYLVPIEQMFGHSNFFAEIINSVLVDSANADRQKLAEGTLKVNPVLVQAAQLKANDMSSKGYFAHTSPSGVTPWYWFGQAGYQYVRAGENLAVNFTDSNQLHQAWMNSPTHRANIVNGNYSEIGIASAKGMYKGQEAVFVVELFGQPAKPVPAPAILPVVSASPRPTASPRATPVVALAPAATPVAVKKVEAASDLAANTVPAQVVLSSEPQPEAPLWQHVLSQPKTVADDALRLGFMITILAIAMAIFVRMEFQRSRLIINGLVILIILAGIFVINQHFSLVNAAIF